MTAPAPSAPISTSRLAHARAPAARAREARGARCRRAWGEGQRGTRKAPAAAEEGTKLRPSTRPRPGHHGTGSGVPRQAATLRDESPQKASGGAGPPGREGGQREGGEGRGTRSRPRALPGEGAQRGGAGARARARVGKARPEVARARAPGGGGGGRPSQRGRAGRSGNCRPGSLPRPGRPAAGQPEVRKRLGKSLTYTVNELVAPRVQFLPKAASLNGALLPPTHPRHLLPPARPCLRRGPAHAQPRRPGPRTHPRPGRRASRRGRCGGRAGLTSLWPRRGPGGILGARLPHTRRGAPRLACGPRGAEPRPPPLVAQEGAFPRPELGPAGPAPPPRCPPRPRRSLLSLPGAFCFLNQPHLSLPACLSPDTNCCKFCGNCFSELLGRNCSSQEPV